MHTSQLASTSDAAVGAAGGVVIVVYLVVLVVAITGMWKMFQKADEPGWAAIVPIYNVYVMTKIVGRPGWWLLLLLVPLVNIFAYAVLCGDMAKSFGKGTGFAVGLFFLGFVFFPALGFGDAQYQGPSVV